MGSSTGDLVTRIQSAHRFDHDALFRFAADNVSGFPTNPSQFKVSQVCFPIAEVFSPVRKKLLSDCVLFWFGLHTVRTWAVESNVSDRGWLREFLETIRFEEEASWQASSICSCC